jgi:hypothetical protein
MYGFIQIAVEPVPRLGRFTKFVWAGFAANVTFHRSAFPAMQRAQKQSDTGTLAQHSG